MEGVEFIINPAVLYAFSGALGIKLLELAELHKVPKLDRPDLRDWLFWVPFIILPILGGGLAQMYVSSGTILNSILAVNVGVSTPLILRAMAQVNPLEDKTVETSADA